MDDPAGQRGPITFLIGRVAVPLLIVFAALLLGAVTTDALSMRESLSRHESRTLPR